MFGNKKSGEITDGKFDTLETIKCLAREPLYFVPGEMWSYSLCHDVLGGFVESVSGQTIDELDKKDCLPKTILYCLNPNDKLIKIL